MIIAEKSNLFDSHADVFVNTVNCEGVMGKGIALEFKKRYPDMFNRYRQQCKDIGMAPGDITYHTVETNNRKHVVVTLATKDRWRNPSKLEWVVKGFESLMETADFNRWGSIAMPWLGCGNGGLSKSIVRPELDRISEKYPYVWVTVHEL